ncbi:MAG: phage protease [Candidatus Sedimenticola sp. (ex Thyasira tokunagai)]
MSTPYASDIGFASCSLAPGVNDRSFQIIPMGEFKGNDGRPREVATWRLSRANAQTIIQRLSARPRPLLIDYEHQTLETAKNGKPNPAAGWVRGLELRDGKGIFAVDTEWTPRAKAFLKSKEYKYLSPVFTYSKITGEVLDLLHIALTNSPALDELPELPLLAAAKSLLISPLTVTQSLSDEELAICKSVGVEPSDYLVTKSEGASAACAADSTLPGGLSETQHAVCLQMGIEPSDYIQTLNETGR